MKENHETNLWTFAIVSFLALILLAGCATEKPASKDVSAPITQHEAAATATSNCAAAIKDIAMSSGGDATSKVVAVTSIERLCGAQNAQVLQAYQPAQQQPSIGQSLWQMALGAGDLAMRFYGIKAQRDVGINASNNAAATTIAGYGAFSNIAGAGFASTSAIASHIQAPAANVTNTTNNTLSGTGTMGSGSYTGPVSTTTTTTTDNHANPSPKNCISTPTFSATGSPTGFVTTCTGG